MRNQFGTRLGLALALVTVLATAASAGPKLRPGIAKSHLDGESFTVSGTCIGALGGEFQLDGITYRLAPDARIYEVGRGFVPQGSTFNYRTVSVNGIKVRNTLVVHSILVRSPEAASSRFGRAPVGIREASGPR